MTRDPYAAAMTDVFEGYQKSTGPAFDEMFVGADVRPEYDAVHAAFQEMSVDDIVTRADSVASSYLDQGITFGVGGEERPFPLDIVPRIIDMHRWRVVEAGVKQRVKALEAFLDDIYGDARVLTDLTVPVTPELGAAARAEMAAAGAELIPSSAA